MEPVTKKIKVLTAKYVKDAESIAILGECEEGEIKTQISNSCFSFGSRTPKEIDHEMEKTAKLMVGKYINLVFDEDLNKKISFGEGLDY